MAQQAFYTKINAGAGVQFSGGTIAQATAVLHTNNVLYIRGGSSGLYLQNADGSDGVFAANDHVQITTANAERLRVTSAGFVGIGTDSPSTKLHVYNGEATIASSTDGVKLSYSNGNSSGVIDTAFSDNALEFRTNGTSKMFIANAGNVGIGTTSPASILHINTGTGTNNSNTVIIDRPASSDYSGVSFATAGTVDWSIGQNSAGNLEVFEDGQDAQTRVTVKTGGDVGIGTVTPNFKLDVSGDVRIEGTNKLRFGGTGSQDMNFGLTIGAGGGPSAKFMIVAPQTNTPYLTISNGSSVNGQVRFDSYGSGSFTGTAAYNLQVDSSGNIIETAAGGSGTVTGSGTATYLPIWTGSSALGNSIISSSGGDITINGSDNDPRIYINPLGGDIGDTALIQFNSRGHVGYTSGLVELGDNGQSKDVRLRVNTADIIFQTSNTTRMTVKSDGLVGIGTTTPDEKLSVVGNIRANVSNSGGFMLTGSSASGLVRNNATGLALRTNTTDRLIIPASGYVGIGIASPAYELDVNGDIGTTRYIRHGGDSNTYFGFSGDDVIQFNVGGDEELYIKAAGSSTNYPANIVYTDHNFQVGLDGGKHIGNRINYCTSQGWTEDAAPTANQDGYYGGNFNLNGASTENQLAWGKNPWGARALIWTSINDSSSNADGGWGKNIANLPGDDYAYMSIVYVKKNGTETSNTGSFYHGCSGSHTLNLDGNANTNPYFQSTSVNNLPDDVWCVSIGIIQANSDANTTTGGLIGGIYRLDTGEKVQNATTFKMKDGSAAQSHRTYLYYSTNTNNNLSWYGPGFYVVDGTEPTLGELVYSSSATNGSGTTGYIPKWQDANTLTDSKLSEQANSITSETPIIIKDTIAADNPALTIYNDTNGGGNNIFFSDQTGQSQKGYLSFFHSDGASQGGGASFRFSSTETDMTLQVGASGKAARVVVWSANNQSEVGYGFADDVNTGMTRLGADQVGLIAGAVQGVYVSTTAVQLKNAGNTKLATTSTGVTVTGGVTISGTNSFLIESNSTAATFNLNSGTRGFQFINNNATLLSLASDGYATFASGIQATNTLFSGTMNISAGIYHIGDTDTFFGFVGGNDTFSLTTGGGSRMDANNAGVRFGGGGTRITTILDEDDMASDSNTALATQQSIKAYVDASTTGVLTYQGTWNADTNSPTLSSGSGTPGYYYIVSTAGTTNLDGITDWQVGDWAVFSDQATDAWQKIDNTAVGNVSGSGTIERLAKWSGSGTIANSTISDDGSTVTFNSDVVFNSTHDVMWDASENRLEFWDNAHLSFGDPGGTPDLLIYHDGSNSYIKEQGTGNLYIQSGNFYLQTDTNENAIVGLSSSEVQLFHNGSEKLATKSGGVQVTGYVSASNFRPTNIVTNKVVKFNGTSLDDSVITDDGTTVTVAGGLTVGSSGTGKDVMFYGDLAGEYFHWDENVSTVNIYHRDELPGLEVYTNGGAQTTQPQLKVGRSNTQYWGVYVDDRNAYLVHRQDETTGIMTTRFDQWDSNTGDNTGNWLWRSGDGSGASMTNAAILYQDGDMVLYGDLLTDSDSTADLGKTDARWSNLWVDNINGSAPVTGGPFLPLAGGTMTGHTLHGDSVMDRYGSSNEFSIYHNGTNGILQCEVGDLKLVGADEILLDAAGEVILDSGTAEIHLKASGSIFGKFFRSNGDFFINSPTSDADIYFSGNDNGSSVSALRLDMSDQGWAHFNTGISVGNSSATSTFAGNVLVGGATQFSSSALCVDSATTNVVATFKSTDNQAWIAVMDDDSGTYGALFGTDTDAGQEIVLANNSATKRFWIDTSGNATFAGNVTIAKSTPKLTFNNLAGGGLDPSLTASGTNFTISTTSITALTIGLNTGDVTVGDELTITTISNATGDPDKFLCASAGNTVGYRTGAQVLSDIGAASSGSLGSYLPLAGGAMTGNLRLNDNVNLYIGSQTDLVLAHNGSNSYISNYVGDLYIEQTTNDGDIIFKCDNGSGGTAEYFRLDGGSTMNVFSKPTWHGDGVKSFFGNSQDLQIYHDGTDSYIDDSGTGDLRIRSNFLKIEKYTGETMATFNDDNAVTLYYNNSAKLATTSTGVAVTGNVQFVGAGVGNCGTRYITYNCPDDSEYNVIGLTTGGVDIPGTLDVTGIVTLNNNLRLQDSDSLQLGNSQDLEIYHASGNSNIDNKVGHLYIRANVGSDTGSNIYIQAKSGENSIICNDDGSVNLYYNNSAKLYTHGSGVGAAGYYGFGSAGTSTGSSYYFRYGSSSAGATQGMIISTSDTGGSYFDGVAQFRNTNTGQGANMFQMINYGALYGRYINFYRGSTSNIIGYIGYNSSNTAVTYSTSSSDIRLKKNIVGWDEDVLPKFLALTPKKFDFKAAIGDKGADKVKGFIAQYETKNFPEVYQLNGEGQDARYGFHPMEMVPYLMKAVKELAEKNEDLERRLAALEK